MSPLYLQQACRSGLHPAGRVGQYAEDDQCAGVSEVYSTVSGSEQEGKGYDMALVRHSFKKYRNTCISFITGLDTIIEQKLKN